MAGRPKDPPPSTRPTTNPVTERIIAGDPGPLPPAVLTSPAESLTCIDGPMAAVERWRLGTLEITRHSIIPTGHSGYFYRLYENAFAPLRTQAAARHVLLGSEFDDELTDSRIEKYIAWSTTGETAGHAIGLATITRHLEAVPWISPEFYRARFPAHASRDAIFYLGFVLAHPAARSGRVFHRLMEVMTRPIAAIGGVAAYDICAFNNETLRFADRVETTLNRFATGRYARLDQQQYYAVDFSELD